MRAAIETLRAVRDAIGPEACLGIRISADEFIEGGLTADEMGTILRSLVSRVAVDFVNVSHSAYHASLSLATQMADMTLDAGAFRGLPGRMGAALRASGTDIPVMAVCRFRSVREAEEFLAAGEADMVGMARAHIADPGVVGKSFAGQEETVLPCIGCNQGCAGFLQKGLPISCTVNPLTGREGVQADRPGPPRSVRRVLVIGGGPGGMEAAQAAAARGHEVQLWEAANGLGGALRLAAQMPMRREWMDLIRSQEHRCRTLGVDLRLGVSGDLASIVAAAPDVVILATGSEPVPIELADGGTALTVQQALKQPDGLGSFVAVTDVTGEWISLSVIEWLAERASTQGGRVEVLIPFGAFAWRVTVYSLPAAMRRLREHGVRLRLLHAVRSFEPGRLTYEDLSTGEFGVLEGVSSLVGHQPGRPRDGLRDRLRDAGLEVVVIGDALAPRTALEAVYEGDEVANAL